MRTILLIPLFLLILISCSSEPGEDQPRIISYPMGQNLPEGAREYFESERDLNINLINNPTERNITKKGYRSIRWYDFTSDTLVYKPAYIQFNDSLVYIFDSSVQKVKILNMEGALLRSLGQTGNGPGEFQSGFDLKTDNSGRIYVSDLGLSRVSVFGPEGDLEKTYPIKNGQRIALLSSGSFSQSISADKNIIKVFDTAGNEVAEMGDFGSDPLINSALSPELESNGSDKIIVSFTYAGYIICYNSKGNVIYTTKTINNAGEMPFILTTSNFRTTGSDQVISWDMAYSDEKIYLIGGHVYSDPDKPDRNEVTQTAVDIYSADTGKYRSTILIDGNYEGISAYSDSLIVFNAETGIIQLLELTGI